MDRKIENVKVNLRDKDSRTRILIWFLEGKKKKKKERENSGAGILEEKIK